LVLTQLSYLHALKEPSAHEDRKVVSEPTKLVNHDDIIGDVDIGRKLDYFPIPIADVKEIQSDERVCEPVSEDLSSPFNITFFSLLFCQLFLIFLYTAAISLQKSIPQFNEEIQSKRYGETLHNQPCSEVFMIDNEVYEVDANYSIAMADIKEKLASDLSPQKLAPVHKSSDFSSNLSISNPPFIKPFSTMEEAMMIDSLPMLAEITTPEKEILSNEKYYQNECSNLKKQLQSIQNYFKEYKAEVNAQHERDYITKTRVDESSKAIMSDLKTVTKELIDSKSCILSLESHYEELKKGFNKTKNCETKGKAMDNSIHTGNECKMGNILSIDIDKLNNDVFHSEVEVIYKSPLSFPSTVCELYTATEDNDLRSLSLDIPKEKTSRSVLFTPRNTCISSQLVDSPRFTPRSTHSSLAHESPRARMNVYSQHLQNIRESQATSSKLPRPVKRPFKRMDSPRSVTDSWINSP
jgi:hypothetical protein